MKEARLTTVTGGVWSSEKMKGTSDGGFKVERGVEEGLKGRWREGKGENSVRMWGKGIGGQDLGGREMD